jgi:hypothetical protein
VGSSRKNEKGAEESTETGLKIKGLKIWVSSENNDCV